MSSNGNAWFRRHGIDVRGADLSIVPSRIGLLTYYLLFAETVSSIDRYPDFYWGTGMEVQPYS